MLPCRRSYSNSASWEQTLRVNGANLQGEVDRLKKRGIEEAAKARPGLVQAIFDFSWNVHRVSFESGEGRISFQLGPWQAPISHRQISMPNGGGIDKFRHQNTPNSGRRRKSRGDQDAVHSKRRRVGSERREGGNAQSDQHIHDSPARQDQDCRGADQSNRTSRTTGVDDPTAPPPEGPGVARELRGRQFEESQRHSTVGDGQCGTATGQFTADSGVEDDPTGPIHMPAAEPPFPGVTPSRTPPTSTGGIGSDDSPPPGTAANDSHREAPVQNTTDHPHPGTAPGEQNALRDGVEDPGATYASDGYQGMGGHGSAPEIHVRGACGSTGNPSPFPTPRPMEGVAELPWFDDDAQFEFDIEDIQVSFDM